MGKRDRARQRRRDWLGFVFVALCAGLFPNLSVAQCRDDLVMLRGDWGQARFTIELADDASERARGLMFREKLPSSHGMLFVYPSPQRVGFWMKNTLIPLDMVFVDPSGTVLRIHENAIPHDQTVIDGGDGVLAVLEVNGGMARRIGIRVGDQMQHPAFGSEAIWPCVSP